MAVLAVAISLIATAYWVLAAAARRGNASAVGVVIVIMVVQICLSLISSGIGSARNSTGFQPNVTGLFIPILVLIALASSRKVLTELQDRNLWEQAFASAKPSGKLCVIGATLLVAGFLAMDTGTLYLGWRVGQERTAELRSAKAFVHLIKDDEQEFMTAMRGLSGAYRKADVETELPERTDRNFFVKLSPEQQSEYEGHEGVVARLANIAKRRPLTQQAPQIAARTCGATAKLPRIYTDAHC